MAAVFTPLVPLLNAPLVRVFLLAGVFALLYHVSRAIYRLYLHPLAAFSGPYEAALSNAWLHKVHKTGHQEETFERLHKQYNTSALRIGPNELHISDVSLYGTLYRQSHPFQKDKNFYDGFLVPHSSFQEDNFDLHKERRRLLGPYFSRAGIFKIEAMVQGHVSKLHNKMKQLAQQGTPINIRNAYRCGTADIITEFAFGISKDLIDKSDDDFNASFLGIFDAASSKIWDNVYVPLFRQITTALPQNLVKRLSKETELFFEFINEGAQCYQTYKTAVPKTQSQMPTIFDSLSDLPDRDVVAEASNILFAGTDTTAFTLYGGIRLICANSAIKQKLTTALRSAFPSNSSTPPSVLELEAIPYLRACIKESLRVALPVRGRLPRIVPAHDSPLVVDDGKVIPPGTTVGISAYTMHFSEQLWGADARAFDPERWMDEKQAKEQEASLVIFSKGVRNCIGQNLAMAELYMMFYMLFRNFDVEMEVEGGEVEVGDYFATSVVGKGKVLLRLKEWEG